MNFVLQPMHVLLCSAKTSVSCSPHFPLLKSPSRTSLWTDDATAVRETVRNEVFSGFMSCFYTFQKRGGTVQRMREVNIGSQTAKA